MFWPRCVCLHCLQLWPFFHLHHSNQDYVTNHTLLYFQCFNFAKWQWCTQCFKHFALSLCRVWRPHINENPETKHVGFHLQKRHRSRDFQFWIFFMTFSTIDNEEYISNVLFQIPWLFIFSCRVFNLNKWEMQVTRKTPLKTAVGLDLQ